VVQAHACCEGSAAAAAAACSACQPTVWLARRGRSAALCIPGLCMPRSSISAGHA